MTVSEFMRDFMRAYDSMPRLEQKRIILCMCALILYDITPHDVTKETQMKYIKAFSKAFTELVDERSAAVTEMMRAENEKQSE